MTNVAHYRKLRGMSQETLAAKVGVKQPHISRIEKGDDGPPLRLFRDIAEALGVRLSDLFSEEMTAAELALLDAYRHAEDRDRKMMMAVAAEAASQAQTGGQSSTATDAAQDQ